MAKIKGYQFVVEGKHDFPFDMLRYDRCWPRRESEDSIAIGPYQRGEMYHTTRQVTLIGLSPPTNGRWESFGWKVLSYERVEIGI